MAERHLRILYSLALAVLVAAAPLAALATGDAERIAAVTKLATDFSKAEDFELNPGGKTTSFAAANANAFSQPSANMTFERRANFSVGNGIFRKLWVSAPSSTASSDGLGPLWNARACQNCHLKDGRGRVPEVGEDAVSLFLRLSVPPQTDEQRMALAEHRLNTIPEPTYGGQLQTFSIQGHLAEGRMAVTYEYVPVTLDDGSVVTLRKPVYAAGGLNYGPLHPDTMMSPRIAPPMIGVGLLEAIPDDAILAHADPDDADGDGISGRPNRVWDVAAGQAALGRFGWKAGEPNVAQQVAHAFAGDIGLSSPLVAASWGDCTDAQAVCRDAQNGSDPVAGIEVTPDMFDLVVFYSRNLAVPTRRGVDDPQVLAGKRQFYEANCTACHVPKFVTRRDATGPEQAFQLAWPYTDLLLHDMGEGLADGRPEGEASGSEWRTPPLWGIGLTGTVSGQTTYLHDGRARDLLETILWHGGEAEASKQKVMFMTKDQRDALLAFLGSL